MNRKFFILISFISILGFPCFASSVTIKKGDTLSKIASENNISIKEIMNLNNIIDANQLTIGQEIVLPLRSNSSKIHVVKKGENLNQISKLYDVSKKDLVELNKIRDPDYLQEGKRLSIPESKSKSKDESNKDVFEKDSNQLVLSKEEHRNEKDGIAKEWKSYGPLKINLSSLKSEDESLIANSIHESGKPLFIAVNCNKKIINRTGANGMWKDWISPRDNFEYDLVNDLCKKN